METRTPLTTLQQTFGFPAFRAGQLEVIDHLLAGRSAAAVFPTGSGKSLCYQLPALLLDGVTLVVSPLIALMKEQTQRLRAQGVAAASLDSTLTAEESRAAMDDLRAGRLKLLYLAPERFNNERTRAALLQARIALFAVDEAHCISEWGHNFRPDYLKLARFAKRCGAGRILALTATATPAVLADVCRGFAIDAAAVVRTGFHRPNLSFQFTAANADRPAQLVERLRAGPPGPAIVYVTTQRAAETLTEVLTRAGFPARTYHAGMETPDRDAVQAWFQDAKEAVVVATIAFGMGVDKAGIRAVYHYNLPKSLENYSQEAGRAGRDGEPAHCEALVASDDLNQLETFVYGDTPDPENVRSLVDALFRGDDDLVLNLFELSAEHDLRSSVLSTLLTYLELDGFLEAGTPLYAGYKFQPSLSSKEILERVPDERRALVAQVLRHSVKARTWFTIDLAETAAKERIPRDRVVEVLDDLATSGFLTLKAEGIRHRYKVLRRPAATEELTQELHARFLQRERRELSRLAEVMRFVTLESCQASFLGAHFGEPLAQPCGRCTWCLTGHAIEVPPRPLSPIDEALWQKALALRAERPDPLHAPRSFARFLCGLPSPRLSRKKLLGHPLAGSLAHVPFQQVLARIAP